ncbi:hypothetical protein ACB092_05G181100 [Castanea dentata]
MFCSEARTWRNSTSTSTNASSPLTNRAPPRRWSRHSVVLSRRPHTQILREMAKGLIWATAEDLARNRGRVLSLYRQILRSINSPKLPLTFAARLAKKAEVRAIFLLASEETSLHNIEDLIDTAEYSLSLLRKGEIPKYIQ